MIQVQWYASIDISGVTSPSLLVMVRAMLDWHLDWCQGEPTRDDWAYGATSEAAC